MFVVCYCSRLFFLLNRKDRCSAEEAQDYEKAYNYYKDVYSSDVTFGDLNERMLKIGKLLQGARK